MSHPLDPHRSAPSAGPLGGRVGDDGVIRYGTTAPAEKTDEHGVIHYPGDEEAQRAPGSALVLVVLSLVAGGLYVWLFWPQKSSFDWATALTLRTPEFAVVGGIVMWGGGVLFIRHGLVWASRTGAIIAAVPMAGQLIDSFSGDGSVQPGAAALAFLLSGGPALLVLALSFSPKVNRWRHRRRHTVAAQAQERRDKRARIARAGGG